MAAAPQSQASMLATVTTDLDRIAPRFEMQPDQITIIQTPAEFYETLKVGWFYFSLSFCHVKKQGWLHSYSRLNLSVSPNTMSFPYSILKVTSVPYVIRDPVSNGAIENEWFEPPMMRGQTVGRAQNTANHLMYADLSPTIHS
jgi:hypothetical protein